MPNKPTFKAHVTENRQQVEQYIASIQAIHGCSYEDAVTKWAIDGKPGIGVRYERIENN